MSVSSPYDQAIPGAIAGEGEETPTIAVDTCTQPRAIGRMVGADHPEHHHPALNDRKLARMAAMARMELIEACPEETTGKPHRASLPTNTQPHASRRPTPRDYAERIPIVGMYNLVNAEYTWETRLWIVTLASAAVLTMVYIVPTVIDYAQFQTVLEVSHREDHVSPFPPVHFCVLHAFNGTFLYNDLLKNGVYGKLRNDTRLTRIGRIAGMEWEYYYHATLAFGISNPLDSTFLPDYNASRIAALNEMIYRAVQYHGSNWTQYRSKYQQAMVTCENVFKMCTFNEVRFPCCYDGSYGYPSVYAKCYKINISEIFPGDPFPHQNTGRSRLSMRFGVRDRDLFEMVELQPIPALVISKHAPTLFDVAHGFPSGASTHINVKRKQRRLFDGCIDRYQFNATKHPIQHADLIEYFTNMTDPAKYSVKRCTVAQLLEMLSVWCGCVPVYDTLQPNDTNVCTPHHLYACYYAAFQGNVKLPENHATTKEKAKPKDLFQVLKERAASECLPLCDEWEYEAQITFASLQRKPRNYTLVTYGDVEITIDTQYQLDRDVLKIDFNTFLASIGDQFGLFLGLSFVGILQMIYWAVAAYFLKKEYIHPVKPMMRRHGGIHTLRV